MTGKDDPSHLMVELSVLADQKNKPEGGTFPRRGLKGSALIKFKKTLQTKNLNEILIPKENLILFFLNDRKFNKTEIYTPFGQLSLHINTLGNCSR